MSHPQITVILNHHLPEVRPYLDASLKAVLQSVDCEFEVILLPSYDIQASNKPLLMDLEPRLRIIHNPELLTASAKIKFGVENAHPESKAYLFLSDDVIVSRHLLATQFNALGAGNLILNPLSNGDLGNRFLASISLKSNDGSSRITLHPNMSMEELEQYTVDIWTHTGFGPLMTIENWVPFYCTMVSKVAWYMVGPLDERLDLRHNDEDWCFRARNMRIYSAINLNAFALHFGSKTINKISTEEDRNQCTEIFVKKMNEDLNDSSKSH
jgi:GT2 family glycosyltransferase